MILSSIMAYFYQQFSGQLFACSLSEKYFILPWSFNWFIIWSIFFG